MNTAPKYPLLDKGQTYASGKVTMDAADVTALLAGDLYINVHTIAHPDGAARAQIEPTIKTIYRMEANARNKGDVPTVMSLFADAGVQIGGGLCALPNPCLTKAAIQRNAESGIVQHLQITPIDIQVSGDTLTAREVVRNDTTRAAGIDRQIGIIRETYQGDKIGRKEASNDASDPQTAAFNAFVAARAAGTAAPAVRPPSTGDGGLISNHPGRGRIPEFACLLLCVGSAGLLLTRLRIQG